MTTWDTIYLIICIIGFAAFTAMLLYRSLSD